LYPESPFPDLKKKYVNLNLLVARV
jgi:hypothetical protein